VTPAIVVHMTALSARRATILVALSVAAACYDRPNAAPSADRQAPAAGEPADAKSARADSAAVDAAATAALPPEGEVPKRTHRDSVALASMTKPDSVLDAKWPVKMPPPRPGAVLPA
jgi:hypothetical protein